MTTPATGGDTTLLPYYLHKIFFAGSFIFNLNDVHSCSMRMAARGYEVTPGQLVNAVAIALDVPEETVVQHDRNLVVAGLRTKGGRGHSAATVTPLDAARLIIAVIGSFRVRDSVSTVKEFESALFVPPHTLAAVQAAYRAEGDFEDPDFVLHDAEAEEIRNLPILRLPKKHNFVEAVAELIAGASAPVERDQPDEYLRLYAGLHIVCQAPDIFGWIGRIEPELTDSALIYEPAARSLSAALRREDKPRSPANDDRYLRYLRLQGIYQNRSFHGNAILLLGRAFRENGLPFKTTQEAISDLSEGVASKTKKRKLAIRRTK
jgi:hypothetical protein